MYTRTNRIKNTPFLEFLNDPNEKTVILFMKEILFIHLSPLKTALINVQYIILKTLFTIMRFDSIVNMKIRKF